MKPEEQKAREEVEGVLRDLRKSPEAKRLDRHFQDKAVEREEAFKHHGKKPSGKSAGYVAERSSDGYLFMMKHVEKTGPTRNKSYDAMSLVNEFITAPLYRRMLYDRAPIIELVESKAVNDIALRSKFLHEFQTLSEYTSGNYSYAIGKKNQNKLGEVEGWEKLIAAMLMGGEFDNNAGNLGVMKVKDEAGQEVQVFAKIDHGWSATEFFTDPIAMMENLGAFYKEYQNRIPFDWNKFAVAIDEIGKISDEEIETIVRAQVYKLKQNNFEIGGLEVYQWVNDKVHNHKSSPPTELLFDTFDKFEAHCIESYKEQLQCLKEVGKALAVVIEKMDVNNSIDFPTMIQKIIVVLREKAAQELSKPIFKLLDEWSFKEVEKVLDNHPELKLVNATNDKGDNLLTHMAKLQNGWVYRVEQKEFLKLVDKMVSLGVSLNHKNNDGKTAFDIAKEMGKKEMATKVDLTKEKAKDNPVEVKKPSRGR